METPLPELLLQHGQFVRTLAYQLVHDPHRAEDAAQEAWLKLVQRPPDARGSLRGWMRRVLFNQSVNARRAEQRREARELATAREEALPSPAEEVERGELLQRVVTAVVALDEPYRSTLLERYFQGREAREIAEATGTPLATVRSREQRGLAELRARLDRELGSRAGWALGLARLAVAPAAAAFVGTAFLLKLGAALFVGALGGIALRRLTEAGGEPVAVAPQEVAAASLAAAAPPGAQREPVAPAAGPVAASPAAAKGAGGERAAMNASQQAELRGRLVLAGGAPAAGAVLEVRGWEGNDERVLAFGRPQDWVDPRATADEDGRFAIAFDPPRAYQFILDARASVPGYAAASWRWSEIRPGAVLELGEIELPRAGAVEGRLVDGEGRPLLGQSWQVYGDSIGLRGQGRNETRVFAMVDPTTASFRLEGLWPGRTQLKAYSEMANWVDGPQVIVTAEETLAADIVYRGPDNTRRIGISIFVEPYYVVDDPAPERMHLEGAAQPLTARWIRGSSQSYSFDGLEPGVYSVVIDDPRFLPWRKDGVTPGTQVDAYLVGSSAVRLSVLGAQGAPVERFAVRVSFRNVGFSPRDFDVHDGASALAGGLVAGLVPGDYRIAVRCADGASGFVDVDDLAAGETRAATIALDATAFVTGRVLRPDGAPAAGAEVLLVAPAEVADSSASPILRPSTAVLDPERFRKQVTAGPTGADGSYRFDLPASGSYAVVAIAEGGAKSSTAVFAASAGQGQVCDDLVLAVGAHVRGRILGPEGARYTGLRIQLMPEPFRPQEMSAGGWRPSYTDLAADGTFELGPLPPGRMKVLLQLPAVPTALGRMTISSSGRALGVLDLVPGATVEVAYDLLADFPGIVRVRAEVNGLPRPGLEVKLGTGGDPRTYPVGGVTDAAGEAEVRAYPGSYGLALRDPVQGWLQEQGGLATVQSSAVSDVIASATTVAGALALSDSAGGQPLAGLWVRVLPEGWPLAHYAGTAALLTDAEGRLALELPPGSYRLVLEPPRDAGPFPVDPAELRWTDLTWTAQGPLAPSLQL